MCSHNKIDKNFKALNKFKIRNKNYYSLKNFFTCFPKLKSEQIREIFYNILSIRKKSLAISKVFSIFVKQANLY
jgi:hypothetical protein